MVTNLDTSGTMLQFFPFFKLPPVSVHIFISILRTKYCNNYQKLHVHCHSRGQSHHEFPGEQHGHSLYSTIPNAQLLPTQLQGV